LKNDYKVVVTEEDVVKATAGDWHNCIWKRAIERTIPQASRVKVVGREISLSITKLDKRFRFATPKAVHESLKEFDRVGPDGARKFIGKTCWIHFDEAVVEPIQHKTPEQRARAIENTKRWMDSQREMSPEEIEKRREARIKYMKARRRK